MWFRIMEAAVSCENGNELLGSTNSGKFLEAEDL
jgi:hypothetical protein